MERTTFQFDGGNVRLTPAGMVLATLAKMIGTLLIGASVIAFMALLTFVLTTWWA